MKKFIRWAVMPVVAMAMALSFTACGSDDPEDADGKDLEGAWYCVESEYSDAEYPEYDYSYKAEYKKHDGDYYPSKITGSDVEDAEGVKMKITDRGDDRVRIRVYYCEEGEREWYEDEDNMGYIEDGVIYLDDEELTYTITSLKGDKMTTVAKYESERIVQKWERK